jgi:hypothetical protein
MEIAANTLALSYLPLQASPGNASPLVKFNPCHRIRIDTLGEVYPLIAVIQLPDLGAPDLSGSGATSFSAADDSR